MKQGQTTRQEAPLWPAPCHDRVHPLPLMHPPAAGFPPTPTPQLCVSKIHRIYVVDSDSKPIRVVSLSDILKLFVTEPKGYLAASFDLS